MKIAHKAYLAIFIAIVELAITPILLSVSGYGASSQSTLSNTLSLLFFVFIVGSIASLAISYAKDKMRGLRRILENRNTLMLLIAAGLFNDAISQALLGIGSIGTNPGIGAIIFRTWTIMVVILSPLVLRNKVSKIQLAGTMLGFAGAYLIISNGTLISINGAQLPYMAALLLAALAATFSNLIMKRHNTDTIGTIALFNIASAAFLGIFMVFLNHGPTFAFTTTNIFTIFFLGLVAYAIGSMLYFYSLRILGPMMIGNIILVVPFLPILVSWLAIGTPIKAYYFAAAILLSVGIAVQQKFTKAPEHIRFRNNPASTPILDITGVFANTKSGMISEFIMGNGRALCIKLNSAIEDNEISSASSRYGCLIFTTDRPCKEVSADESSFIRDIISLKDGENALVGIGRADRVEKAFDELHLPKSLLPEHIYTKSE